MNWLLFLFLPILIARTGMQEPSPAATSAPATFPEDLLKGEPNFSFALLFQGDLRGNFGPCG